MRDIHLGIAGEQGRQHARLLADVQDHEDGAASSAGSAAAICSNAGTPPCEAPTTMSLLMRSSVLKRSGMWMVRATAASPHHGCARRQGNVVRAYRARHARCRVRRPHR